MNRKYLFIFYFIFCLSTPTSGGQINEVIFPDQRSHAGSKLILNGMAMRTFTFFDVYAAALYLDTPLSAAASILDRDAPRLMVMHFLRSVAAEKITEAWMDGLAANTPDAPPFVRENFATLGSMMENMNSGETLECHYAPSTGTTIVVKGKTKGVIQGKDFQDALLACWIGPKPGPGEKFRAGLLGAR